MMNASIDPVQTFEPERTLSGATRVFIAFVMGTLFALLPVYYLYTGRDAALRVADAPPAGPLAAAPESLPASESAARFAARMTYELSQTPTEAQPAPMRVPAPVPATPAAAPRAGGAVSAPVAEAPPTRVQNARPIIAAPLEPRDTTRAMEKESRVADYRETQARPVAQPGADALQPRVVEGREIIVPPKPAVPTRAIGAAPAAESDASKRRGGEPIAAAGMIAPAPQADAKAGAQPKRATDAARGSVESVDGRLAATREWLGSAAPTTHTIQLMGAHSEEHLKAHIKSLAKMLDPTKIYVFRTVAQGKPAMTVVYGSYADRKAALEAFEKLPAQITANKPVLRTVNGIRNEQKQHGTDS